MQTHGPKRIYTPQSLEFWFARLEADWEGQFGADQVERGQAMYRDGEIRELELGAHDAIIHRKVEKKEEYAVIEWEGDQIKVRSSSTDLLLANAIAVAGLHEIEELLVDEMTALLPSASPKISPATNGHQAPDHVTNGDNGAKPDALARDLLLSFTTNTDGLVFLAEIRMQEIDFDGQQSLITCFSQEAHDLADVHQAFTQRNARPKREVFWIARTNPEVLDMRGPRKWRQLLGHHQRVLLKA